MNRSLLTRSPGAGRRRPCFVRCRRGFALVEVLVTLTLLSVLMWFAAPAFASTLRSSRLDVAADLFVRSVHLTRAEALRRGSRVSMCRSSDGVTCASRGTWAQGWVVFHDPNRNGEPDAQEEVVSRQEALDGNVLMRGNLHVASTISFTAAGGSRKIGGGFQAGTIILCHQSVQPGDIRSIVLSSAGRIRVEHGKSMSCS